MADTTTSANNKAVTFKGRKKMSKPDPKPSNAPDVAEMGLATAGIPAVVEKRFDSKKERIKKLPPNVRRAIKKGLVSDSALKSLIGDVS